MPRISKVAVVVLTASIWAIPSEAVEPSACTVPAGATLPSCHEGAEVETQNCWQRTIVATRALTTSYRTMKLKVTFSHPPTGNARSVYAFYDGLSGGRDIIRFRSSFKDLGAWNYSFACEAGDCQAGTGLTNAEVLNRSVTVTSLQAASSNPLFTKGHPTVSEAWAFTYPPQHTGNGPLIFRNGEPFLWVGDSAWAAPLRSLPNEWIAYINDRKARNFSLVQIGIAPEWAGGCIESDQPVSGRQPPFTNQPSGSFCAAAVNGLTDPPGAESASPAPEIATTIYPTAGSLPNATFWKRYEEMVQYANCQGITVLIASVMAPVQEFPTFENVAPFARNLAARFSGNAVILSPTFDDGISQATCGGALSETDLLIREIGNVLTTTAPHLLTTGHFGTMAGTAAGSSSSATLNRMCNYSSFSTDPWLDFWMGQSGQNGNRLSRITERPRTLISGLRGLTDSRFSSNSRSVVNGEAIYDSGMDPQAVNPRHNNRFRARQAGWLSWLSGATGYTFGAQGIWEWGICGLNPPPGGTPSFCSGEGYTHTAQFESYNRAMDEASSQDMTRLRYLIANTQWSSLVVNEQSRIKNQPCDNTPPDPCTPDLLVQDQMMVVARDPNWLVVYAPHNARLDLQVPDAYRKSGTFFTPRADDLQNGPAVGTAVAGQPGVFRFDNPENFDPSNYGNEDFVLGLPRSASFGLGWAGASTNRLEARPLSADGDGSMALMGQLTSATGLELSTEIEVSNRTKGLPFGARAARDGSGNFVIGWQDRGADEAGWKVWLRRIDSGGIPIGAQIDPSQTSNRCRTLSVATNSAGAFVALWEEWNPVSDRFELRVRSYAADGTPMTDSLPFVSPPSGQADSSPHLACDANGSCVAAWERRAADAATAGLWLVSFSLASPWSVSAYEYRTAGTDFAVVESLVAEGVGDFELAWEELTSANESLGVTATQLNASALPVGIEYEIRGPWGESE